MFFKTFLRFKKFKIDKQLECDSWNVRLKFQKETKMDKKQMLDELHRLYGH